MRIAVVVHPDRPAARVLAGDLAAAARALGSEVVAEDGIDPDTDVVIAVGGDGTVLRAVALAHAVDAPVLGVNVGHVGFLAAVDPDRIGEALGVLAGGSFGLSDRMTLEVWWEGGRAVGINDVVIEKVVSQRAVRLALRVDGRHFTTYRADGLVLASPTGSTAYAFSAGGPVVDPELEALLVTPVAAHNLFAPTVLFGGATVLEVESTDGREVRVNVDGWEAGVVEAGVPLHVRRGERPARFVVPWPRPFTDVVRDKFHLAQDESDA